MGVVRFVLAAYFGEEEEEEVAVKAGAGTRRKLRVLHVEIPLPVLLREEWWAPCLSPSEGSGDEARALAFVFRQRAGRQRSSRALG